ncbi:hypothetical protein M0R19_06665 [Candidatus Pacearchaeota archaeon]|nr:hypothetical protein [Candidatus Pacearchaeota archaeon]
MSLIDSKKINAIFVLEVIGRPQEYLAETLNNISKQISEEKGVKVKDTKINEPVLLKDQKDLYTSFAEIEVETEGIIQLAVLIFKYMPAHIDILSPQNINLTNNEWCDVLNEITRRLHGYEEIARVLSNEKFILENKLKETLGKGSEQVQKKGK